MKAYVFPGQGSQFPGMAKDLYDSSVLARELFSRASQILGFDIAEIMFTGTEDQLKQTKVTQSAIFLHSVILALVKAASFTPDMVAGHSLGELSALTAVGVLSFEDGLKLVAARAQAMQKACEANPSAMAAILGLDDNKVEEICSQVGDVVVPANYNCPGQIVISGTNAGVEAACVLLTEAGAKRVMKLAVGGAFHSPLMNPAKEELARSIENITFNSPACPVYQNVDAAAHTNPQEIKANVMAQLTGAVRWTQTIKNMVTDGANSFIEVGPGKVLQGLIKKIHKDVTVESL